MANKVESHVPFLRPSMMRTGDWVHIPEGVMLVWCGSSEPLTSHLYPGAEAANCSKVKVPFTFRQ